MITEYKWRKEKNQNKAKAPKLLHDPYQWSADESADNLDWQDLIHSHGKIPSIDVNQVDLLYPNLSAHFISSGLVFSACPLKFVIEK